ncbi:MAG TPA: alpha/beta hydrolase-fold protein [Gaiellaceae bacterium]|nr:alpha/beta hydrolase-fold protein [Gaiellaceae bacterium]
MKTAFLALAGAAAVALGASPAPAAPRRIDTGFRSAAIDGTLHYEVYLPSDYATSSLRYPVLYVLHGLPSTASAYTALGFVERALDTLHRQAILVVPQGARAGESDPEYVDQGPGHDWATAIASELPRIIDARFRTIRASSGRAIIGISAGGYGAMQLALHHLDEFSAVESWSGYFHPTDPTGTKALALGPGTNVHRFLQSVGSTLRRRKMLIAFYVGRSDPRFFAENETLNQELSAAGVPHVFRAYAGGHDQSLWQRYAAAWLELALVHLRAAH